ncbi:MAG TPA: S1/P1 nuclease, partial [Rhodanobacteraceae bacterium]|nr:S1/P1 nuclease [Rhodanobacteraceae bacterium]
VRRLLATEDARHLDDISSWADAHRKEMKGTGGWHYVDIPLHATGYEASRDCRDDNCVVAQLVHFTRVLADRKASDAKRLEALKWVVHMVGDIHQPLHAEDDNDKGGNTVQLQYFGQGTNLHAVWDSRIIEHQLHVHLGPNYSFDHPLMRRHAAAIDADITQAERDAWAPAGMLDHLQARVIAWANASHQIARDVAYADLPKKRKRGWAEAYQRKAWPVVRKQVQRGGVRLAELLNEVLR